ncbi:ABC transporter [Pseudohyphozyma bogoriensis]|nr:ABC transporter [Pseudohyphozyma bogoriensis]
MRIAGQRIVASLREAAYLNVLRQDIGWHDLQGNSKAALASAEGTAAAGQGQATAPAGSSSASSDSQASSTAVPKDTGVRSTGDIISRLGSDASIVGDSLTRELSEGLRALVTSTVGIIAMSLISPHLTLAMLAIVPPISVAAVFYGRFLKKLSRQTQKAVGEMVAVSEEKLGGVKTVQAFNTVSPKEEGLFKEKVNQILGLARKEALASGLFAGGTGFAGNMALLGLLSYGGTLVSRGEITVGALTSLIVYTAYIGGSLIGLTSFFGTIMKGLGASSRIFELLDARPVSVVLGKGVELPATTAPQKIVFDNVRFAYPARPGVEILKGVNLTIEPGSIVSLAGGSGSGKSTVASLLVRYYDPSSGTLKYGDDDVRGFTPESWRARVAIVPQDPALFTATIAENIAYGQPNATRAEIEEVARLANCGFINSLPRGYETQVGARGAQLSGGQRQRLAIARALLQKPKILVCDEATSALDAASENLINQAIANISSSQKLTTILIAHRLSTLKTADVVVLMEDGVVAEQGTTQFLQSLARVTIPPDGYSRHPEHPTADELDLNAFEFSYEFPGCPQPHHFTPSEACDLLLAFGGAFIRGDSLMRQFTQGLFILFSNSFELVRDHKDFCSGDTVFTNGFDCKFHSIFDSREMKNQVCREEVAVLYQQVFKTLPEPPVWTPPTRAAMPNLERSSEREGKIPDGARWRRQWIYPETEEIVPVLHHDYKEFVDELSARRRNLSTVYMLGVGIHYYWNVTKVVDYFIDPFLSLAPTFSPAPLPIFSLMPAPGSNKPVHLNVTQGVEATKQYNSAMLDVLRQTPGRNVVDGAWTAMDWFGSTSGAESFDARAKVDAAVWPDVGIRPSLPPLPPAPTIKTLINLDTKRGSMSGYQPYSTSVNRRPSTFAVNLQPLPEPAASSDDNAKRRQSAPARAPAYKTSPSWLAVAAHQTRSKVGRALIVIALVCGGWLWFRSSAGREGVSSAGVGSNLWKGGAGTLVWSNKAQGIRQYWFPEPWENYRLTVFHAVVRDISDTYKQRFDGWHDNNGLDGRFVQILGLVEETPYPKPEWAPWQVLSSHKKVVRAVECHFSATTSAARDVTDGAFVASHESDIIPRDLEWAAILNCPVPPVFVGLRSGEIALRLVLHLDSSPTSPTSLEVDINLAPSKVPVAAEGSAAICVSPMWGHTPAQQLVEWRQHHLNIGVDTVHWYARDQSVKNWVDALNKEMGTKDDFMYAPPVSRETFGKAEGALKDAGQYADQTLYYLDCKLRSISSSHPTQWVSFTDLDEHFLPASLSPASLPSSLPSFLKSQLKRVGSLCISRTNYRLLPDTLRRAYSGLHFGAFSSYFPPTERNVDSTKCLHRVKGVETAWVHRPDVLYEGYEVKEVADESSLMRITHDNRRGGEGPMRMRDGPEERMYWRKLLERRNEVEARLKAGMWKISLGRTLSAHSSREDVGLDALLPSGARSPRRDVSSPLSDRFPIDSKELMTKMPMEGQERPRYSLRRPRIFASLVALGVVGLLATLSVVYRQLDYSPATRYVDTYEGHEQWYSGNWSDEEAELRTYVGWPEHDVHESLTRVVDELDEDSKAVYEWLRTTRPLSNRGTPIGLSSTVPPARIKPAPPAWNLSGPGEYKSGSIHKYGELLEEWRTGRQFSACVKGTWEEEYATLHASILNGTLPPRTLEFRCVDGELCGGLSDRMFGAITTFTSALLTKRAFTAAWEYFLPIDMVFDSPYIDWSAPYHPNSTRHQHPIYNKLEMAEGPYYQDAMLLLPGKKMDDFMKDQLETDYAGRPWAQLLTNIGSLIRTLKYVSPGREKLYAMGLRPQSAYTCIFDYLFKPKPAVLDFIARYTSLFSLPNIYTITLQIRTGDAAMVSGGDTSNTIDKWSYFFNCAERVAQVHARPDQRVVFMLLSDSEHLKKEALAKYPGKVMITGIGASHVAHNSTGGRSPTQTMDALQDAVADAWVQEGADFQIISRESGFGRLQAFRRGKPGTTIALSVKGKKNPQDCGLESSIALFEDLIEDTSLG